MRPLYDNGASSAAAATRDDVLQFDTTHGVPSLNVFGSKITTYRRRAESAMAEIAKTLLVSAWPLTAGVALSGGGYARWYGCADGAGQTGFSFAINLLGRG